MDNRWVEKVRKEQLRESNRCRGFLDSGRGTRGRDGTRHGGHWSLPNVVFQRNQKNPSLVRSFRGLSRKSVFEVMNAETQFSSSTEKGRSKIV